MIGATDRSGQMTTGLALGQDLCINESLVSGTEKGNGDADRCLPPSQATTIWAGLLAWRSAPSAQVVVYRCTARVFGVLALSRDRCGRG
jgi:hypothetical protein